MMNEHFETYEKRTLAYKIISLIVYSFLIFIFTCIFFPEIVSQANQPLMICFFVIGSVILFTSMFINGSSFKTCKTNGHLFLTDSTISINEDTYLLEDLLYVETTAGMYKGQGSRGGLSDGSGNRIIVALKNGEVFKRKFVISTKTQKENLIILLKYWKASGFKIISNGIDLI